MSDKPLTDASKRAHVALKVDGHGKPVADASVGLTFGHGWTLDAHAQYGKAMADRYAAVELNWKGKP